MDYRALTVSREFGSGGGRIAKLVADHLGWKLLDRELIEAIACSAHVDAHVVSRFDERPESWLGRLNRGAMRGAALSAGVIPDDETCFDPETMAQMTQRIIENAWHDGNCVIVGRGAQCILQSRPDVFHVFIYAPVHDRANRLRSRLGPGINIEERLHTVDNERAEYLRKRFAEDWKNPHLYNLMLSSLEDEAATARMIEFVMEKTAAAH